MRFWIVVFLTACGTTSGPDAVSCPDELRDGDTCAFAGRCWNQNGFSSCASEWCACIGGRTQCATFTPRDGEACGDEPITSCSYEGNPSCDTAPTSESCSCDDSGTWRCSCACYGGQTTCSVDACSRSPQVLQGASCADHDQVCSYPNNTSCRCVQQQGGPWAFECR